MQEIHPDNWVVMYFGLIFLITGAQILVVYVLSGAGNPTPGLGMYAVYFMATLLGWIALVLQQRSDVPMPIDLPSMAFILNSYVLFLAAGQRAGLQRGRYALGFICIIACLSVFFLRPREMFAMQAFIATLFFSITGLLCGWRSWQKHNVGDGIIAAAALMMVIGIPFALFQWLGLGNFSLGQAIAFGTYTGAYALVTIGFLASVLIEYQQNLSYQATEDPLTQLLNRRGVENALHVPLAQAARQQLSTAALMVDIDHFQEVNRNFGNDAGDQVIKQVAQYLQRVSRASDVVARTGGDEFLLILPHTDLANARILAERIRVEMGERPIVVHQQRIPISVSIGVVGTIGAVELDKLSQDADRAMHLAKRNGRNQVASVENKPVHLRTHVSNA